MRLSPVPPEERLSAGGQLRDLSEDGIYVPQRPQLAGRNLHRLESRLLQTSDRWAAGTRLAGGTSGRHTDGGAG